MLSVPEFTVVVGVDAAHLEQWSLTVKSWLKYKPSLLDHPWLVFYDVDNVSPSIIRERITDERIAWRFAPWGLDGGPYPTQREKMLTGFVYIPGIWVDTPYWLKIDTDAFATGDDEWIDPEWFEHTPAIIGHRWGYTKPANQMLDLDNWVARYGALTELSQFPPLNLVPPDPSCKRLAHFRVASFCAFFETLFTTQCAMLAEAACGQNKIPVPSQDGYLWYCATRRQLPVVAVNMKRRGWNNKATLDQLREHCREV
jgi:hypothetical protein